MPHIALLGLGEAGQLYGRAFVDAGCTVSAFDPAPVATPDGVDRVDSARAAVADATLVMSLVTAAHAVAVAADVAPALAAGSTYLDLNAASPDLKAAVAHEIGTAAEVADGAIIGSVLRYGAQVEVLLSGPGAERAQTHLDLIGAAHERVGGDVGAASRRKLLRSVFMKGLGALVTEAVDAGEAAGDGAWVREQVAAALVDGEMALDRLDKGTRVHAARRASEVRASIDLLEGIGAVASVTRGALDRHLGLARAEVTIDVVDALGQVPTAALGDGADRMNFCDSRIKAVWGPARLSGRALTVYTRPGDNKALHEAIRRGRPGDVLVVNGGGDVSRALMGELIAERCVNAGIRGMVIDGAVRDVETLREIGFPVWAAGVSPAGPYKDGPGTVGETIAIGNVACRTGDVVVADEDGVIVVPQLQAEQALAAGVAVVEDEQRRRQAIRQERGA